MSKPDAWVRSAPPSSRALSTSLICRDRGLGLEAPLRQSQALCHTNSISQTTEQFQCRIGPTPLVGTGGGSLVCAGGPTLGGGPVTTNSSSVRCPPAGGRTSGGSSGGGMPLHFEPVGSTGFAFCKTGGGLKPARQKPGGGDSGFGTSSSGSGGPSDAVTMA